MKIINERNAVLECLAAAGKQHTPLLCPNAETPCEMEGILLGAQRHADIQGLSGIVIGIGVTASYPDHPQLGRLALPGGTGALETAAKTWLHWLHGYENVSGPFDKVRVIPFLDHGWVPLESDHSLMNALWFQEAMGIIMFDASRHDFDKNVHLTAEYVARAGRRVVVEACPDKVYERTEIEKRHLDEKEMLSRPENVERFVEQTGVDLVVPNLGTEHRTLSTTPLEYRRDIAQAIASRIGPRLALHGTSSLGEDLRTVGQDGISKVNFYTAMARAAGHEVKITWDKAGVPLPIALACGSAIHSSRRETFANRTQSMLESFK